jgi:hypothetical protein
MQSTGIYFVSNFSCDTCLISQEKHKKRRSRVIGKAKCSREQPFHFPSGEQIPSDNVPSMYTKKLLLELYESLNNLNQRSRNSKNRYQKWVPHVRLNFFKKLAGTKNKWSLGNQGKNKCLVILLILTITSNSSFYKKKSE